MRVALVALALAACEACATRPAPPVVPPAPPPASCETACARRLALGGCGLPTGAECVALCADSTAADLTLGIVHNVECLTHAPDCTALRTCS